MNALTRLRRRASDDAGFTLMELIVVALLTSLVLAAVGGIYISTVVAQRTVEGITGASNGGQLAARSIDSAVRNASEYEIADSGRLLVVRSADADADELGWFCQAWYFSSANGGSIRSTTTADGTAIEDSDRRRTGELDPARLGRDIDGRRGHLRERPRHRHRRAGRIRHHRRRRRLHHDPILDPAYAGGGGGGHMFLTRLTRTFASIRSLRSDEAGVALAAVLAFMAAGVLFSAIIAGSVVFAYQFTSSTRSGIQAQASAEAGIAAARAGLIGGTCTDTTTVTT